MTTTRTTDSPYQRIGMACQGGGALGAYHIGAYKALQDAGYAPDVVSGISIGAFTAAIIAGNEPEDRVKQLLGFWHAISWPDLWSPFSAQLGALPGAAKMQGTLGFLQAAVFGQPNFFAPRIPAFELQLPPALKSTSYYDTSPMIDTLKEFVDFERINASKTRLILGAVRVKDGTPVFFDSAGGYPIGPEHVIASGALPPGFPGARIDGDLYWDGGCVSNTPIEAIYHLKPALPTLVFMIDLFNAVGKEPANMDEVSMRQVEIMYASRTAHNIRQINKRSNQAQQLSYTLSLLSPEDRDAARQQLDAQIGAILGAGAAGKQDKYALPEEDLSNDQLFDIVHVVLDPPGDSKVPHGDADFSRKSIAARADAGLVDMMEAIAQLNALIAAKTETGLLGAAPGAAAPPARSQVFTLGRHQ